MEHVLLLGAAGLALLLACGDLSAKRSAVERAFEEVRGEFERRRHLIPILVEIVGQHMVDERELLERLMFLREQAEGAKGMEELVLLEGEISALLREIRFRAEAYPDLRGSTRFLQLQGALAEAEGSLAAACRLYNAVAREYNNAIQQFPALLLAPLLGMHPKEVFLTLPEGAGTPDAGDFFLG